MKSKASIKYRVYHHYPNESARRYKYDSADFPSKNKALQHFKRSRSATHIRVIRGGKVAEEINPRTGGIL